jgi:hypothetical protein
MLNSSSVCLYSSNLATFWLKIEQLWPFEEISKIISSETTKPISTNLCWDDSWAVLFQNCVRHFRTQTKMAATAELNLT